MHRKTDAMIAGYVGEIEERQTFIDSMVGKAQEEERDLTEQELELVTRAKERIEYCDSQMRPLEEARTISVASAERIAGLARFMQEKPRPSEVEYRSAGAYVL